MWPGQEWKVSGFFSGRFAKKIQKVYTPSLGGSFEGVVRCRLVKEATIPKECLSRCTDLTKKHLEADGFSLDKETSRPISFLENAIPIDN